MLSPYAKLQPGESYTWRYDWYACNIGGDFSVVNCSDVGVVATPLSAKRSPGEARLTGRFGVFAPGKVGVEFADPQGRRLGAIELPPAVSPLKPLVLDTAVAAPANATSVRLTLVGANGKAAGELARAELQ